MIDEIDILFRQILRHKQKTKPTNYLHLFGFNSTYLKNKTHLCKLLI